MVVPRAQNTVPRGGVSSVSRAAKSVTRSMSLGWLRLEERRRRAMTFEGLGASRSRFSVAAPTRPEAPTTSAALSLDGILCYGIVP